MAVNEARRHHLYETARESWDEEAAQTLIESLPHPVAELATKQDVALLGAELRAELGGEIKDLRAEMQAQFRSQAWRLIGAVAVIVGVAEAIGRGA